MYTKVGYIIVKQESFKKGLLLFVFRKKKLDRKNVMRLEYELMDSVQTGKTLSYVS
jgi:hypothetical protein